MNTAYPSGPFLDDHRRALLADARPLYIAPQAETRVELDGPALCVAREGVAERLYPLQRISRVYTAEEVDWTSEALIACARAGIGVLFVGDDGEVTARVLARPGERDELYSRFMEFLMRPEAAGMYQHWLGIMGNRAARWAGIKLDAPADKRRAKECRDWLQRQGRRYAGRKGEERSRQWLRSVAFGWMQGHLLDLGFGRDNELAQAGEPALARDLTGVLMWYIEPARLGWLRRRFLAAQRKGQPVLLPPHRDLVRLFESRATRAAARGREITSALHRWLIHET